MRILPLFALALVCAGCDRFFDPEIGEGEGEFDGIPEEPIHDGFDPLPDRPELELDELRIQAVDDPALVEVVDGPLGVPFEPLEDDLVRFELDGHVVEAELSLTPEPRHLFGLVFWSFDGGEPVEAVVTGDALVSP